MGDSIAMTVDELAALDWTPMRSTNVREVAYVPSEGDGALYARFASGGAYRYDNVAPIEFEALLDAHRDPHASVGRTLRRRIQAASEYHRIDLAE